MDTLDLGPATRTLTGLIAGVRDDQLDAATPCPAYTVGDLADHIGGFALAFTVAARKEGTASSAPSVDGSRLEDGWRTRIARDLEQLADAWRDPASYDGTATGQPFAVRDEDVATCFTFVEPTTLPENQAMRGGLFGPVVPVPGDAPALDRLLGAAGRRPES